MVCHCQYLSDMNVWIQVVAGLKKHVERDVLLGSLAVAILNLKPAKLAGEASEAMLLAADAPLEGGAELVKVLVPPGDLPHYVLFITQFAKFCNVQHVLGYRMVLVFQ